MSWSGKVGRAAIDRDAGPDPVGAHAGIGAEAQAGRAVGQRALAGQVARDLVEHPHLLRDALGAVGIAEVRHQRDLVDLRQRIQPGPGGAEALRREAQPVHARIHLEEHAVRLVGLVHGQHVDLLVAVHRVPQVQARAQLQVARLEHAFEQQDRAAPAQRAHPLGLLQVEQREAVGAAQALEHALDAMAVGVGLDHAPDPGVGRAARMRARLWRSASVWMVAWIGRGMAADRDFVITSRDITPCRLETALKITAHQPA